MHDAKLTPIKDELDCITAQSENLPQLPDLIDAEPSLEHPSTFYLYTKHALPCLQPQVRKHTS